MREAAACWAWLGPSDSSRHGLIRRCATWGAKWWPCSGGGTFLPYDPFGGLHGSPRFPPRPWRHMTIPTRPPDPSAPDAWSTAATHDEDVVQMIRTGRPITRDVVRVAEATSTRGQRLADRIALFGGSWTFILLFLGFLVAWAVLNTEILGPRNAAFDPYPYIFLNLFLSMLAALQAPVIMMSQNRQAQRDRIEAANDYRVNLKAELEIRALHDKFDALRERDWEHLVRLQQQQIEMLTRLVERQSGRPEPRDEGTV